MHIKVLQTIKGMNAYLKMTYKGLPQKNSCPNVIILEPRETMQKTIGFGGAFTEAAASVFSELSVERKKEIIDAYFDPVKGIGYTLGRIAITSCDFSTGNYTYVTDEDPSLLSFSILRDKLTLFPLLQAAKKKLGKDIKLFAAPWSPPAWMKTNKSMTQGGALLHQYYSTWAQYIIKVIRAYKQAGFPIFAVSTQNEPEAVQTWESCIYTGEQELEFIKNYLGPALNEAGLDTKITIWDHNRDRIVNRATDILSDPLAARYVWGTAFHWYVSEEFENVGRVHEFFPEKHLIFTEGCVEGGLKTGAWDTGERYGRNIICDFQNWNEGFIDWNLMLDTNGGPNHVGNFCDAPIIADLSKDLLIYNSSYYYIAHFSKFIKPGALRIQCSCIEPVCSTAFLNPDGDIVTVLQNEHDAAVHCNIKLKEWEHTVTLHPHSISTAIWSKK